MFKTRLKAAIFYGVMISGWKSTHWRIAEHIHLHKAASHDGYELADCR